MSEDWRARFRATWKDVVMARTDSEVLDTTSALEQLSPLAKSSDLRWAARTSRVLGILRDRQKQYGDAGEVYAKLGALWSARLGVKIDARMVLLMMMDMKTIRSEHKTPSQDTLDDIVGYAVLYGDAG